MGAQRSAISRYDHTSGPHGPELNVKVRYCGRAWYHSKILRQRRRARDAYGICSRSQEIKPICICPSLQSNSEPRPGDKDLQGRVAAAWIIRWQNVVHQ